MKQQPVKVGSEQTSFDVVARDGCTQAAELRWLLVDEDALIQRLGCDNGCWLSGAG